jgi:glycyl-tRNA synthetase beta chain
MVMVEDPALRANRLALLARLARRFDSVADISRLATG